MPRPTFKLSAAPILPAALLLNACATQNPHFDPSPAPEPHSERPTQPALPADERALDLVPTFDSAAAARSIVLVRFVGLREGQENTRQGVVMPGGSVLTCMRAELPVRSATIVSADGREHIAIGTLGVNPDAGAALLAVDWQGTPPPGIPLAPRPAERDLVYSLHAEGLRVHTVSLESSCRCQSEPLEYSALPSTLRGLFDPDNPGRPLLDADGRVVGTLSGIRGRFLVVGPRRGPALMYTAVHPEVLGDLEMWPAEAWEEHSAWITRRTEARPVLGLLDGALRDGDQVRAIQLARAAVGLDDRSAYAWFRLGQLQNRAKNHVGALDSLERAEPWLGADPRLCLEIAVAAYGLDLYERQLAAAERVLELTPGHPIARWYGAMANWRLGERESALAEMAALADENPDNPEFASILDWMLAQAEPKETREIR